MLSIARWAAWPFAFGPQDDSHSAAPPSPLPSRGGHKQLVSMHLLFGLHKQPVHIGPNAITPILFPLPAIYPVGRAIYERIAIVVYGTLFQKPVLNSSVVLELDFSLIELTIRAVDLCNTRSPGLTSVAWGSLISHSGSSRPCTARYPGITPCISAPLPASALYDG